MLKCLHNLNLICLPRLQLPKAGLLQTLAPSKAQKVAWCPLSGRSRISLLSLGLSFLHKAAVLGVFSLLVTRSSVSLGWLSPRGSGTAECPWITSSSLRQSLSLPP